MIAPPQSVPPNSAPIEPIPRERQLEWRRSYLRETGEGRLADAAARLEPDGGFATFSRLLDDFPLLRDKWNGVWREAVAEYIREWASVVGVAESVWLVDRRTPPPGEESAREFLRAVIDSIPEEELNKLQIPLSWVVNYISHLKR